MLFGLLHHFRYTLRSARAGPHAQLCASEIQPKADWGAQVVECQGEDYTPMTLSFACPQDILISSHLLQRDML